MWVLQNFPEHLLLQNTSGGCFCIYWFDAWKNQNQSIKYILRQKQLTSETDFDKSDLDGNLYGNFNTYLNSLQKQPPEVLLKKGVLKNFRKCTGKHLQRSLFFKKVTGLRLAILSKKRFQHSFFLWILRYFEEQLFTEHLRGTASAMKRSPPNIAFAMKWI